jgi:hypothetical protein
LNATQIASLEQLFNTHPAIQAARSILHGQLLSGGIALRREGKLVELKPAFKRHLDEVWIPFAQEVVDSFLKFGFVVVSYEEDEDSLARQSIKRRALSSPQDGGKTKVASPPVNLIPIVPPTDTYDVAYVMGGRVGYHRKYLVYARSPSQATKVDEEARVFVRQHPDSTGNLNSPMATIFDLGSFVSALTELAMVAEITNSRPRVWTQLQKETAKGGLDPQSLFFDSESRGVASSADTQDNAQQLASLAQMQAMTSMINKLQTSASTGAGGASANYNTSSFSGQTVAQGKTSHVPPDVPPSLFTIPKVHASACSHPRHTLVTPSSPSLVLVHRGKK